MELEKNEHIPFLDVIIYKLPYGRLSTSVYPNIRKHQTYSKKHRESLNRNSEV